MKHTALTAILLALPLAACGAPGDDGAADAPGPIRIAIETGEGVIEAELYPDRAPASVEHFIAHVSAGTYDGGSFYRTVREDNDRESAPRMDLIQGGAGWGGLEDSRPVIHEPTSGTGLDHRRGAISLGRWEPGTADSEFFIVINDSHTLDAGPDGRYPDGEGYAVFGYVVSGMEVAETIWQAPAGLAEGESEAMEGFEAQALDPVVPITSIRVSGG
ncbi:peptidylprolyl isomerase [Glycocaulis profundi]|nr:peptidylprolyl isomerase [Glycocaulis profundi]